MRKKIASAHKWERTLAKDRGCGLFSEENNVFLSQQHSVSKLNFHSSNGFPANIFLFFCSKAPIGTLEKGVKYVEINDKNTRTTSMTSFWCFCCSLWTYFTPFSSVSIAGFEQVNVSWVISGNFGRLPWQQVAVRFFEFWLTFSYILYLIYSQYVLHNFISYTIFPT